MSRHLTLLPHCVTLQLTSHCRYSVARKQPFNVLKVQGVSYTHCMQYCSCNAFNFNDKSLAEVEVGGRAMDEFYEFYVSDNGPGIPYSERQKVFEIFYVLKPFDRYGEFNSGIGLANVKRLLNDISGEITLESSEGEGTIFIFSIPPHGAVSV